MIERLPRLHMARTIAVATPLVLLSGAYIFQYGYGMQPCEMCWWQRYAHFAALALALLALLTAFARQRVVLVALAGLAILTAGLIGGFHAGVEYRWWQGLTACTAAAGSLDDLFAAPIVRCDVAPWSLLGISMAGWNFLFSTASALAIFSLMAGRRKDAP